MKLVSVCGVGNDAPWFLAQLCASGHLAFDIDEGDLDLDHGDPSSPSTSPMLKSSACCHRSWAGEQLIEQDRQAAETVVVDGDVAKIH